MTLICRMVDAAGTTKYTYYAGGLLNTEDGPWTSDTVTYNYNNARLRSGLTLQQPSGSWTNGFLYDAAHRLTNLTSSAGRFSYAYRDSQPSTLIKKLSLPNSGYITNTFDNVARLTGTYLKSSSNIVLDTSEYLYNTNSQRIRLTRTDGSYYTNTYDNIGQLKVADSTTASEDRYYGYDAAWNLNKRTNNTTVYTFTVNNKNELTNYNGSTFIYDSNGNLIGAGSPSYTYNAENQLVSAQVTATWRSEFTYDGRGRLRKRIEYSWTGSSWYPNDEIHYLYDGMRVIQERNSGNTPTVAYTRGSDLSDTLEGAGGIGGLLSRSHAYQSGSGSWTNHNYYHADGGGNITYLVNSSQSMVASYRYDPFGNTISSSGTLASANVYRFSSKEQMPNTGLYYYGYRFYDPNLQRWLNRDPFGEPGFEVLRGNGPILLGDGANLYAFVANSPIDVFDVWGLAGGTHKIGGPCCLHSEEDWKLMGYRSRVQCINDYNKAYSAGKIGSVCGLGLLLGRNLATVGGLAGGVAATGGVGGAALTGWEGGLGLDAMLHCLTSTCVKYGKIQPDKSCK